MSEDDKLSKLPERVVFQYSVDLGEVPSRAKFLIQDLSFNLSARAKDLEDTANKITDISTAVEAMTELHECNTAMQKYIVRVEDIMRTMTSYFDLLVNHAEANKPAAEPAHAKKKSTTKKKSKTKKKATTKKAKA